MSRNRCVLVVHGGVVAVLLNCPNPIQIAGLEYILILPRWPEDI